MRRLQNAFSRTRILGAGLCLLLFVARSNAGPAYYDAVIPDSAAHPAKNLARMNIGAQLEAYGPDGKLMAPVAMNDGNRSASPLIMDDDTISCPLQTGENTFVVSLPEVAVLERFTFVNENAEASGHLRIAISNHRLSHASEKWVDVNGAVSFARKRLFSISLVGIEAKYVRLSFQVEKGGRIAAFGIFGETSLQRYANLTFDRVSTVSFTHPSTHPEDILNYNFANLYARAKVVFVSSGALALSGRMIDDDTDTSFRFAMNDRRPTVVVELAGHERIHRVSALYKALTGRVDVFVLNDLPRHADLDKVQPIFSTRDREPDGKTAVDFDPQGARYVAFRWTPDALSTAGEFEVIEVAAFGNVLLSTLVPREDLILANLIGIPDIGEGTPGFTLTSVIPVDLPDLPVTSR